MFGCSKDEAAVFKYLGERLNIVPTTVKAAVCETIVELAKGNRCISVDHRTTVSKDTLLALRNAGVEYICTRSVGYDHIDLEFAHRIGITVGNVAYSPDSVADYSLMLMLMVVRHAKSTVLRTDIRDYRMSDTRGKELRDLTVGVVGAGRIGSAVVERLRGFGSRVLTLGGKSHADAHHVRLDELIEESDILTLHTPLTAETHYLLDRRRIERLKPGAFVINTGRGSLLDTKALLTALESGRLGGAALDVIEGEEGIFYTDWRNRQLAHDQLSRLQQLPNVVISPHSAYYTDHALYDFVENSLLNCLEFESEKTA